MKKLLSIILVLTMIFALAACKGEDKKTEDTLSQNTEVSENEEKEALTEEETDKTEENEEVKKEEKEEKEEVKQEKPAQSQTAQDSKPADKAESKPENKPAQTPAEKPAEKPVQKPAEETKPEEPKSVAYTLVDAFKANASSDCLTIAEKLVTNPVIAFAGGAMSVEEGYLTGFDDTEIKGFKSGAMFAPMIGTIPFVGYVFELESADKASAFISTLKSNANLRWNICTSADEMVASSVGNKVFFVMSPLSFEE